MSSPTTDKKERDPQAWINTLLVGMAIYLAGLGGFVTYYIIDDDKDDRALEALVAENTRNARIADAEHCIDDHKDAVDTRAAINVTPDALVEISGNNPDTDPAQLQAFVDSIQRRIAEAAPDPTCNLLTAQRSLEILEAEAEEAEDP